MLNDAVALYLVDLPLYGRISRIILFHVQFSPTQLLQIRRLTTKLYANCILKLQSLFGICFFFTF